jgi:hypothetical protein
MKIRKFNESTDFSIYHPITDEEILDLSLEMTDMEFGIHITRKFADNNDVTYEPISKKCYPIYQIDFQKDYIDTDLTYLYDGSYYYQELDILKSFISVLSKMKKILPVEDAVYTTSNTRLSIRLILKEVNIKELGFEFRIFNDKLKQFLYTLERGNIDIKNHWSGPNSTSIEIFTQGKLKGNVARESAWKKFDIFDNKEEYNDIINGLLEFSREYDKFIFMNVSFIKDDEISQRVKTGVFSSAIKTYEIYTLEVTFKQK